MAQYVPNFAEPSDAEYAPPVQKGETPVRHDICRNKTFYIIFLI